MPCSPEQLASNRRNAARSTGPSTPEGKARSRANAVKHGLSGEGLALPIEDAAEVERRFVALGDDLRPVGEREQILARRAALLSVRLDRCARYEVATLSDAIRAAEADFDHDRLQEVEDAVKRLADDPASSVRRLERTPEGVDWMLRSWGDLAADLSFCSYLLFTQVTRAENLLGRKADEPCGSRINALAAALSGDFRLLDPPGTPLKMDPDVIQARKETARVDLLALVQAEVDRLRALQATLPFDDIARSRAGAPLRRLFDPSTPALLFRRYETAAARELHKTFAYFDAPRPEVEEPSPEMVEACEELGSSRNFEESEPTVPPTGIDGDPMGSPEPSGERPGPAPSSPELLMEPVPDVRRSPGNEDARDDPSQADGERPPLDPASRPSSDGHDREQQGSEGQRCDGPGQVGEHPGSESVDLIAAEPAPDDRPAAHASQRLHRPAQEGHLDEVDAQIKDRDDGRRRAGRKARAPG